ncbi:hypothetical protein TrVGV298_010369 [Trichoderma virens]|nr:hypothetical protein TrVGV298_010369 [Trichoderma virens]
MGLAPATSDFPGPKASPEPSSTRLNPFDDSDVSSRKRRRTSASGSGSPSASVETGVYLSDSGSSPFYTTVNAMPVLDGAVQPSQESKQPRTPPQNVDSPTIPPDPPASRGITINLRNPPSRASTASPTRMRYSPTAAARYVSPSTLREPTPEEDKAKKSVEEAEPDVATNADADDGPQTPPTGWRASLSPPIEELFPGDHEMPDQADVELAANTFSPLDTGNVPPADPTMQFPYCDADTLPETVTRLHQFLSEQPPIEQEVSIYEQVRAWLDLYVQFAKARTPEDTFNSVYNNRVFWQSFLGLCGLITNKNLSPSAPPRLPILQRLAWKFSHSFVALTAQLVIVDFHTVRDWQAGAFQSSSESPSLISMDYLRQLHQLAQRSNYGPGSDPDSPNSASLGRSNLIAFFIEQLHDFTLEVIDSLCVFATGLIEIVQAFPRLVNILTPVIQSLTDCLNESCRPVRPGEPDEMTVKSNLIHVYHVWGDFSSLLLEIIEKHVGTLSSDGVSAQIQALAELLRRCLLYDGEGNITLLNEHRAMYPDIEGPLVYEAILWGWKVGILERLIKSSQMPLRLMSVTTMCSELVTAWKRYGIQSAVPNRQFTNHLGRLLLQTELIDYILGPNCHPELITESANIIGYLIVTKLYDQAHTDRLWQGITETQDPRVAKAVAKMANSVANLLDYPTLMSLCEKLQALPTPDFNQATKALWDTIHQELLSRCRAEGITLGFLPYDLCLRLLREAFISSDDPQPPSMEAQSAAMDKFRALLQFGPDSQGRQELYSSCIKDIAAKSPTTLGSLCCLTMAIRPNIADEMDVLIQEHDLVRLLVEELGHAVKLARTTSASLVFHGRFNQPRKDFIANLVRLRPDAISEDLGKRLWDLLVGPACLSDEDRNAGWEVFMDFGPGKVSKNPFLQLCFSQYLPDLPPSCFSRGMLLCVKKIVLAAVNNAEVDCDLDDETFLKGNGIEQLWRFVMGTSHASNAEDAIGSLAVGVYIKSQAITAYPFNRARRVQSAFVNRCLSQLKDSAMKIMASSDGASSGEDEPMVMVATEEEMLEQERIFTRALQLLRVFMEFHYTKPTLCAPDFRSIFHEAPCQVEGDLTALKYQSFDDGQATAIKPLHVGKLNTAAELISNLKFETGFDNYRAFYRGRQFLPLAKQVRASLESLHVEEGMILVKREENDLSGSTQIPSAASPLEIQVMSHFSELWGYLSLDDRIAKEVYSLLIKLPTGRHIINLFESPTTVYTDLFPPGQPYKFLYAIQAISKHIESVRLAESNSNKVGISYKEALRTSSSLVSQAISDESLLDQINPVLQVELMGALMHTFTQLLRNTRLLGESPSEDGVTYPDPGRLVNILADAANGVEGESSLPLIDTTLSSILQLCLSRSAFMKDIVNLASFKKLLHRLILLDPPLSEDARPPSVLMQYFWLVISDLLFEATGSPHQCQEFFDGIDYLFCKAAQAIPCELFMNGEFRRFILAFNIEDPNDSQQLLFHTQKLFGYLQDSYRRCIDPGQLVNSIKTYDDVLIDIHNQMDVEEFYSLFFDRLESQPMTDDEKKKLRSIYGGQLVQQVKSQECEHVSERLEPFSAIQCDIHGKVSLRESLDAYVRGEVLEGDNKYKCSSCDRHVNAVKRACLKEVPDNLIFHLKRFEFNLRTQQRNKVNDYFSFPPTIDMRPYTIDHLSNPTNTDQQDDMFELVGILIHAGTAESGHYYSYIRERTSTWDRPSWVEFNDDVVTPWDPRQMAASAFGGTAGQPTGLDSGGTGFDKTYSAYMLFYQRSSSLLAEQQALLSTQEVKTPLHVDTDITPLKEHILNDNTVLLKRHCLYDPSHVEFVQHCFRHAKLLEYEPSPSPDEEQSQDSGHGATATHPHALKTLAMEMALSHFDQLVTRIEGTPNFDSFAAMIQSAVVDCRDCAFSFFEYFNIRPEAFRALVQRNPDADVRAFTGTTMVTVLRKIATEMPQIYDRLSRIDDENELASNSSGHEESLLKPYVLEEVMVSFDRLWRFFQFHLRSWDEVFGMMLQFAQLGPREVAYLLSNDFLLKLLRIIAADASMELPPNYAKMLHTIYRRPANRPPSYESILKLISYLLSQLESTLGSQYIVDAPEDRLAFHEPPFPWTSDEVHLIHHHPDRQLSSIFVEKLLGIDQAREATHSILGRLTALSTQMDLRVYTTLRRKIQGDTTTEPLDPFLRGASVYLETTLSASHSQNLMRHIAAQAESLHSTEGMAFLEHFQASLNLKRKDGTMAQTTAASSLETLPDWVPHLLAFPDNELRYNTERFLDAVLFSSAPNISAEDTTMQDGREGTRDVIQRLGIACLLYLRDAHIRRRILIGRDTAVAMVRVVGKCADYFSLDAEDDDNGSDFRMLQDEVVGSLKRFVVDEDVEDDGSDWEGSCISSDPVDCQPDIGVQQIGEPDDANAI